MMQRPNFGSEVGSAPGSMSQVSDAASNVPTSGSMISTEGNSSMIQTREPSATMALQPTMSQIAEEGENSVDEEEKKE